MESANNIPYKIFVISIKHHNEIPKYQLVLYDFNNEIIETERLHTILADLGYTNEEINKFNLQDYLLH